MKCVQIIKQFLLIGIIIGGSISCSKNPTEPNDVFIEPKMISITENLMFTLGPSWDTTFVPPDSLPMLIVELKPYEIGKYELTNEEYEKFVKDGGYNNPTFWSEDGWNFRINKNWSLPVYWNEDKLWLNDSYSNKKNTPVHGISYYEAEAYCEWLSNKTNKKYKIPSSYQWVRAAKGPDPGTKYPWGNDYSRNFANYLPPYPQKILLNEVNSYMEGVSIEGCNNMIGNAFEICLYHQYSNPQKTFGGYYSIGILSAVSSGGDPYYRAMTTMSSGGIEKEWRFYALGLRIVKEN